MGRRFSMQRGTTRVVFGAGSAARIPEELEAVGGQHVLVVCSPGRSAEATVLAGKLGGRSVGVLALAREHVAADTVATAREEASRMDADVALALGGGSAIGLAKAIALSGKVRVAAVPTTYSGSEMTPVYGITEGTEKKTGRDERARPVLVVYDPELSRGLARDVTMTSLWNAMAHAVEALWVGSPDRATRHTAETAMGLLASSLRRLAARLDDAGAREDALEGAYLAGSAYADVGGGLHHRLCHFLGGAFAMPHAATHAALLPHVVRLHREAAPEAMVAIARALGLLDPVDGIARLAQATGVAVALEKLGMPREGVERAVEAAMNAAPLFPGALDRSAVEEMMQTAWSGPAARPSGPPLRAPREAPTQAGFGATLQSEALANALPHQQNAPRRAPYGLFPELLNGTPFTVRSAENSRVWMYRVRPSFSHTVLTPLPSARFAAPLEDVDPNRTRWRPLPIPDASERVDFLDGLVTLGGAGGASPGPGYAVHLYAANADMTDRSFSDADGDVLVVPQTGGLDCRTELGWLRVLPGSVLLLPRALRFAMGLPDGHARGWVLEVFGRRLRLPERGLIGSNGLADARHFVAPVASYEDRACPGGFQIVTKLGGRLHGATQEHSPFDVVAWHGNHVPFAYDLALFSAMGSVRYDHPDPSILTVLTAPLDDHGRAIADFVIFPGRWEAFEGFRPPFMHRNAASEVNMVVRTPSPESGYDPGCTFLSPLLTPHGVAASTYDRVLATPEDVVDPPRRGSDGSLWVMVESALPFHSTAWARETPLVDREFLRLFEGVRTWFDPERL
jgi:homogentisate 1,2-dioxygenase